MTDLEQARAEGFRMGVEAAVEKLREDGKAERELARALEDGGSLKIHDHYADILEVTVERLKALLPTPPERPTSEGESQ